MAKVEVPEIPRDILEALNEKTFGPADIRWIKNVNDKREWLETAKDAHKDDRRENPFFCNAYIYPHDPRVIKNESDAYFCLQASERSRDSLYKAAIGDIILLYQKLEKPDAKNRCFSHLVTPISHKVVQRPYGNPDDWHGRWVKVIAMTGREAGNRILVITRDWQNMLEPGSALRDLGFGDGVLHGIGNGRNPSGQSFAAGGLSDLQK